MKNGNEDETARLLEYTGDLLRDTLNKWMPELIGSELKLAGEEFQAYVPLSLGGSASVLKYVSSALNKQRLELEEASKLPAFFKFTQGHTDADKLKTARENIEINVREFDVEFLPCSIKPSSNKFAAQHTIVHCSNCGSDEDRCV